MNCSQSSYIFIMIKINLNFDKIITFKIPHPFKNVLPFQLFVYLGSLLMLTICLLGKESQSCYFYGLPRFNLFDICHQFLTFVLYYCYERVFLKQCSSGSYWSPRACHSLMCFESHFVLFCWLWSQLGRVHLLIQVLCSSRTASCFSDVIMNQACFSWLADAEEMWHGWLYCLSTQGQVKAVSGFGRKWCWQQ